MTTSASKAGIDPRFEPEIGRIGFFAKAIKDWVEKKIRRHMGRSQNRRGYGWKRWSRQWIYEDLKLFNGYRVRRATAPKALPAR
jgi:hypothetical protein